MTTATIDLIHRHGSVRHYRPDALPPATVEEIVLAAQRSATSSNLQMMSAVAVADAAKRSQLAELCGNQAHIAEAPIFIAWCADLARLQRACLRRGYRQEAGHVENFLLAVVDVAIAMQTATLAAESLGLGTCYIGGIRNHPREVIALLRLPRLVFPVCGMTLGWPARQPMMRPRLPLRSVLHWEAYDPDGLDDDLDEFDRAMVATGIYRGRQVPVPGKPAEVEEYGWQEHSARRVSQAHRTHLRAVLAEQGFELQ